jgi:hypothetical protein
MEMQRDQPPVCSSMTAIDTSQQQEEILVEDDSYSLVPIEQGSILMAIQ